MKISEVYKKFFVTPNLQDHMLTVAGVAMYIMDHWTDEAVNRTRLEKMALLHDLANTVKFDLVKHPEFLGDEQVNLSYWKNKQQELIKKYGADDHIATGKMLEEIGIDDEDIKIIQDKSFGNSRAVGNSNNWLSKILLYSDLRVLPFGIGTLEERFKDILERMPKYSSSPEINQLFEICRKIENEIQKNMSISLDTIKSDLLVFNKSRFLNVII